MVGAAGFEPATSRTPSVRATRLRHAPTRNLLQLEFSTPIGLNQFQRSPWTREMPRDLTDLN